MERLKGHYRRLLEQVDTGFVRYLYERIDWNNRFIAILGARGVGKTTMLLQHIKMKLPVAETLYVSADDLYFTEHKLFDLADDFYKNKGKFLFIDEIHKYANWAKELKMMYDYFPELKVVFTGSSVLEVYKGSDDLSRRVISYYMQGLSFREFLELKLKLKFRAYTLDEITRLEIDISQIPYPLVLFKEYLQKGYYPFFSEPDYEIRLRNIINTTLEQDIPAFAKMNFATSQKLKHLLLIISESVPFKPNHSKISELVGVHRNQIADFFHYLERAGLINQLRTDTQGIRALGKVEKIYLENTNLMYALSPDKADIGNIRETFFFNQTKLNNTVTVSNQTDFNIGNLSFEIGGKNKTKDQIKGIENAYIAKDDIEYGHLNVIPLWYFGFNY